ncbi:MAG: hypothetical protein QOG38_1122, partial [Hyphomicrobiales bacterium]|nr:hypothetical protein [Hyphomicrobiales bacterium]
NLNLVGRLLSKLYLRYEDSGIVYTVRFFLPKSPPERHR